MASTVSDRRKAHLSLPVEGQPAASDPAWAVGVVLVANAVIVVGLWFRHGGLHTLSAPGATFIAAGQLFGLTGAYAVLVELLLMSRIGWLERGIGFDRLAVWHRWGGFASVTLLSGHVVFITMGYASSGAQSLAGQTGDFVLHYPDVLMSFVAMAIFFVVGATSVRIARRRLSRESWYAVHLYAYLAVALGFAHQLSVGNDFSTDRVALWWWVTLYAAVFGSFAIWRVGRPLLFNARHRLRVDAVRQEVDGVVSIYISGRHLGRVGAQAGQFFLWRFLTGSGWAKAHPFSLSAAPSERFLRITVKALGDDTLRIASLRRGTRVFAEGPYGKFTAERRTKQRTAFIAGGIGITPLRALLESMQYAPGDATLLYRVASEGDIVFQDELDKLSRKRGVDLRVLVDAEIGDDQSDGLGIPALRRLVPDIAERDVYVCGPPGMLVAVRRRLLALAVPSDRIHFERFEY